MGRVLSTIAGLILLALSASKAEAQSSVFKYYTLNNPACPASIFLGGVCSPTGVALTIQNCAKNVASANAVQTQARDSYRSSVAGCSQTVTESGVQAYYEVACDTAGNCTVWKNFNYTTPNTSFAYGFTSGVPSCPTNVFANNETWVVADTRAQKCAWNGGAQSSSTGYCVVESTGVSAAVKQQDATGAYTGRYLVNFRPKWSGSICANPNGPQPTRAASNCAVGSKATICLDSTGPSTCATSNGEKFCADSSMPEAGSCKVTAAGNTFCVTPSPGTKPSTPPAPNNGTPGQVAPEDAIVTATDTTNGTTPVGPGATYVYGPQPNNTLQPGTTDDGSTTGGGEAVCGASPLPPCEVTLDNLPGQSDGAAFDAPELESGDDFATSSGGYLTRITNAPIVAALGGLASYIPSGTGVCPTAVFDLDYIGTTLTMDVQCTLFEDLRDVLGWMMLVCYGIVAVRIMLSA